jgi:hypothetical protein
LLGMPAARPSTPPLGMVRELRNPASPQARGMRLEQTMLTDMTRKGRRKQRWQLAAAVFACCALLWAGIAFGMRTRAPANEVHPAPAALAKPLELTPETEQRALREDESVRK